MDLQEGYTLQLAPPANLLRVPETLRENGNTKGGGSSSSGSSDSGACGNGAGTAPDEGQRPGSTTPGTGSEGVKSTDRDAVAGRTPNGAAITGFPESGPSLLGRTYMAAHGTHKLVVGASKGPGRRLAAPPQQVGRFTGRGVISFSILFASLWRYTCG